MQIAKFTIAATLASASLFADPILKVPPLYQNDSPWSGTELDHTGKTIGELGCSLTAWTMLINYELTKNGFTTSYTPADINKLLNDYRSDPDPKTKTVYDGWGDPIDKDGKPTGPAKDINEGGMRKAIEQDTAKNAKDGKGLIMKSVDPDNTKESDTPTPVDKDYKPLKDSLAKGEPVLVRVNGGDEANPIKNGHTVLVIGQDSDGNWLINDPYKNSDPGSQSKSLNDPLYKNQIYRFWAGIFQHGGISDPYQAPSPYPIDPADLYDPLLNPNQYGLTSTISNTSRAAATPEPSAAALMSIGIAAIAAAKVLNRAK